MSSDEHAPSNELPPTGSPTAPETALATAPGAGAVRRLVATLLDMAVFSGLSALLAYPLVGGIDWAHALASYDTAVQTLSDPGLVTHACGVLGLWTAAWWSYFVVGWGGAGATPGKRLLGLCLVDHRGRLPIGMARAALRLVAYMVSSLTLGLGHLLVLVRRDRRALHDILAGTRVVRRPRGLRLARGIGHTATARSRQTPLPDEPAGDPGPQPEPSDPPAPGEVPRTADRDREAALT
jgi:uncharacterized RDD family membrane protein YckC